MGKLEKLTDKELLTMATGELIKNLINLRDGKKVEIDDTFRQELERRKLSIGITKGFINRVIKGEFDNADALEVSIKVKGSE